MAVVQFEDLFPGPGIALDSAPGKGLRIGRVVICRAIGPILVFAHSGIHSTNGASMGKGDAR